MIEFLLLSVLVAQIATIVSIWITRCPNDFSKEDVQVKAMTEQSVEATERVVEAKNRLPRKEK